ncbi:hypothetical protein ABPG72_003283 [Tetrahymena utriculariae]
MYQNNFSDYFLSNQDNILKKMQLKVKMKQILKFLPSRMIKQLNINHLKWIGDATAHIIDENRKKEIYPHGENNLIQNMNPAIFSKKVEASQFLKFILNIVKKIPIFHPANKFCQLWYLIQLITINILFIMLPIQLVFQVKFYDILSNFGTQLVFFIMVLDHFIKMNTGYFQKGEVIFSRPKIIKKYLTEHLLDGIIADFSVLFYYWLDSEQNSWIMMLYFFKLKSILQIERQIFEIVEISPINMNFIQLIKLIKNILLVSHYFACAWVQVAYWEKSSLSKWNSITKTWMDQVEILKYGGWGSQYIAAYYFSTVTMITVGYGDIYAVNETEMVLCVFTMIIACGLFAYSINQIGVIFEQFGKEQKEKEGNMYIINRYMNQNQISSHFQYQIRQYLEYYWSQIKENYEKQEKQIIGQLSEDLRFKMKQEANRLVLRDTSIFSNNFSQSLILRIASLIKESTLIPDQKLIQQNSDDDDGSIYFIKKGSLKVIFEYNLAHGQQQYGQNIKQSEKDKEYVLLKEGQYFGQIRFFTGNPRNATVITTDFTKLLSIKRDDFLSLIKQFPQDYETLVQINHVYQMTGYLQNCGIKCYSCQSLYHSVVNCPLLQYKCDTFKLMLRNKFDESKQARDPCFVRENQFKSHAFDYLQMNQISKFDFLDSFTFNDLYDENVGSQIEVKNKINQKDEKRQLDSLFPQRQDSQYNIRQENVDYNRRSILHQNTDYSICLSPLKPGISQQPSKLKYSKSTSIETQEISSNEDIRKRGSVQQEQASTKDFEDLKKQNENMIKYFFQRIDTLIDQRIKGQQYPFNEIQKPQQQNFEDNNQHQEFYNDAAYNNQDSKQFRRMASRKNTTIRKRKSTFILNNNNNNSSNSYTFIQDQQNQGTINRNLNNNNYYSNINNNFTQLNSNSQTIFTDQMPQFQTAVQSQDQIRSNKNIQLGQKQISNYERKFLEFSKFIQQQQYNILKNNQQQIQNQNLNESQFDQIENNFDSYQIFKNFLVHNNIDKVLKRVNDKSLQLLQYYQNQIKLKIILKKRRRQQLKIKKSVLNQLQISQQALTQKQKKEKSFYSQKSPQQQNESFNQSALGANEISENQSNHQDISIGFDEQTFAIPDSSKRFIPINKQILTYPFQNNKYINSITDIIYAANQNRSIQAQFDYNLGNNQEGSSKIDIFQMFRQHNSQINSCILSSNFDD